jgi:hypothetical protein
MKQLPPGSICHTPLPPDHMRTTLNYIPIQPVGARKRYVYKVEIKK